MANDKTMNTEHASGLDLQGDITELMLDSKCYDEAIPHLEKILETEPCRPQDVVDLACAYQQTGEYARAAELFQHVVTEAGLNDPDKVALNERLGYCLLGMSQHEGAAQAFENAIALDATSSRAYVGLGLCMVNTGGIREARTLFGKALAVNPDCADAFSNLGVLALSEDDVNGALDFFKRALEIEPTHRDALPNYLTTTFALGAFEEAYSLLQCYVDSSPDNPDLICQLAYCHLKLGREQEARSLLQDLLKTNPGHEDARALFVECTTE